MTIFNRLSRRHYFVAAIFAALAIAIILQRVTHHVDAPTRISAATTDVYRGTTSAEGDPKSSRAVSHSRTVNSAPLPPKGMPLKEIFDDLKSRADAGDAAAAKRLFNDLSRCRYAQSVNAEVAVSAKTVLDKNTSGMTERQIESNEHTLESLQRQLANVKGSGALCDGLDRTELQQWVPMTLRAAQLGDDDAAECYVAGRALLQDGILDHPEWLADYKQNALAIADQAMARGDWSMVIEMERAYGILENFRNTFPLAQITGYDAAKQYRYFSLGRLGGGTVYGDVNNLIQGLSADDIANGDAWAQATFQRYFSAHPDANSAKINSCQGSDD